LRRREQVGVPHHHPLTIVLLVQAVCECDPAPHWRMACDKEYDIVRHEGQYRVDVPCSGAGMPSCDQVAD